MQALVREMRSSLEIPPPRIESNFVPLGLACLGIHCTSKSIFISFSQAEGLMCHATEAGSQPRRRSATVCNPRFTAKKTAAANNFSSVANIDTGVCIQIIVTWLQSIQQNPAALLICDQSASELLPKLTRWRTLLRQDAHVQPQPRTEATSSRL